MQLGGHTIFALLSCISNNTIAVVVIYIIGTLPTVCTRLANTVVNDWKKTILHIQYACKHHID